MAKRKGGNKQKSKIEELREFYENDLWEFAQYINPHYYYGDIHKDVFRWLQHGGRNQLLLMPRGHLKALELNQKVLTPDGWRKMGEISVGDYVIGPDGTPTKVIAESPVKDVPLYKVRTRDGREVLCNDGHLWTVEIPSNSPGKLVTKTTEELAAMYKSERFDKRSGKEYTEHRVFLPNPNAIEFETKDVPVDPYLLGFWLGDGDKAAGAITTADKEVIETLTHRGHTVRKWSSQYRYGVCGLLKGLKEAGVWKNKHIPQIYLEGDVDQRKELLAGLLDSDGSVQADGLPVFYSTDLTLVNGVVDLVRSLGGTATVCKYKGKGFGKVVDAYSVSIRVSFNPFMLSRKAEKVHGNRRKLRNAIVAIERFGHAPAKCISVDRPDGLFVCQDYMVTHNSHCIAVWTVWQITRDPCTTLVYLSAGEDLANAQVYAIKNMLESERYRLLWPEMLHPEEGKRDKWSAWAFNVDHPLRKERGIRDHTVIVKTVKSNATGLHASHLVFDDIVVPGNAYSEVGRKDVEQAVSQFASILNPDGVTKAVGTRYHPKDVYQSMIEAEIPEYEDPQTGEIVPAEKLWDVREYQLENIGDGSGQYLWPRGMHPETGQWYGFDARVRAQILAKYRSMNEHVQFACQYYNQTNDPSTHRVRRDKFQYYDKRHLTQKDGFWFYKDKRLSIFAAMDVAWTVGKRSDYTAIAVIGVDPEGFIYLLELDQFKTDKYDRYYEAVIGLHHKWGFRRIRVETNSGGKFVAEELQKLIRQNGDSLAVDGKAKTSHDQAKVERHAAVLEPRYESQTIWHYKGGYIDAYEEQLILERPPHDDLLDAVTSAIEISKPPGKTMIGSTGSKVKYIVPNSRFGGIRRVR